MFDSGLLPQLRNERPFSYIIRPLPYCLILPAAGLLLGSPTQASQILTRTMKMQLCSKFATLLLLNLFLSTSVWSLPLKMASRDLEALPRVSERYLFLSQTEVETDLCSFQGVVEYFQRPGSWRFAITSSSNSVIVIVLYSCR
jgi:hypothetical protein